MSSCTGIRTKPAETFLQQKQIRSGQVHDQTPENATNPPSTASTVPVTNCDASESR